MAILIPKKLNVGFRNRDDTYTKKLAYIIYYDEKNKLRKETSWNGWRDESIPNEEFDNIPTSGFVLNKDVGGTHYDYNYRKSYIRVYDPRGFEFEIDISNLLYILQNTNSIKGKGLEGEFVYGWEGKDIILIPTSSPDYTSLVEYNDLLHERTSIKVKDLILGATYKTKNNSSVVYMGKFDFWSYESAYRYTKAYSKELNKYGSYDYIYEWPSKVDDTWELFGNRACKYTNIGKRLYFATENGDQTDIFTIKSSAGFLISVVDDTCASNYVEIIERVEKMPEYSPPDSSKTETLLVDYDDFVNKISSCYGFTFCNKDLQHFHVYKSGDMFVYYQSETNCKSNTSTKSENPKEVFDCIVPIYNQRYLTNGNLYTKEYNL